MIDRITGRLVEKKAQSLIVEVQGISYEVIVPTSVLQRIDGVKDQNGNVQLVTYDYFQISPGGGLPYLIGFINEIERDFFLQFIKVSGIGPKAAVKALDKPIGEVTRAIDKGDINYLTTLPGIGQQRAKEVVAKLQGKIGKFGLIQDKSPEAQKSGNTADWHEEALAILLQLQYKRQEAQDMIEKALGRSGKINSAEELLNEIYKQRIKH